MVVGTPLLQLLLHHRCSVAAVSSFLTPPHQQCSTLPLHVKPRASGFDTRYVKDAKAYGFYKEPKALDQILLGTDEKLINKIHSYLLSIKMEDEQVKEMMIIWARNFGYILELDK